MGVSNNIQEVNESTDLHFFKAIYFATVISMFVLISLGGFCFVFSSVFFFFWGGALGKGVVYSKCLASWFIHHLAINITRIFLFFTDFS